MCGECVARRTPIDETICVCGMRQLQIQIHVIKLLNTQHIRHTHNLHITENNNAENRFFHRLTAKTLHLR